MDYEGILRQSNSLLLLGFLAINVRSRSVVVITCASHAQGPRFEPGRDHLTWTRDIQIFFISFFKYNLINSCYLTNATILQTSLCNRCSSCNLNFFSEPQVHLQQIAELAKTEHSSRGVLQNSCSETLCKMRIETRI